MFYCCFCHFLGRYLLLNLTIFTSETGGIFTPLTRTSNLQIKIGRALLVLLHWRLIIRPIICLSCDPLALSNNARFYCTTITYRRNLYRKIQSVYIAQRSLWIVWISYRYFLYAIILAAVKEPYLIFLVNQIFCRFCSCANCKRGTVLCLWNTNTCQNMETSKIMKNSEF